MDVVWEVAGEKVLVGGDFNGHVGSDMGSFGEVHGDFGIGKINDGGIRLLEWAVGKGLHLMNTCFQKKKSQLITFTLGKTETMIDYILVNNNYRSRVNNVKVIPGEEIVSQHYLLLINMVFKKEETKIWKEIETVEVERELEVNKEFAEGVNNKCDG